MNEFELQHALRLAVEDIFAAAAPPSPMLARAKRRRRVTALAVTLALATAATGTFAVARRITTTKMVPIAPACDGSMQQFPLRTSIPPQGSVAEAIAATNGQPHFVAGGVLSSNTTAAGSGYTVSADFADVDAAGSVAWAVGGRPGALRPSIYRFGTGTRGWAPFQLEGPTPRPGLDKKLQPFAYLTHVSAASESVAWAVGSSQTGPFLARIGASSYQTVPYAGAFAVTTYDDVAALSNDAAAVLIAEPGSFGSLRVYDGTWRTLPYPRGVELITDIAAGAGVLWAVGSEPLGARAVPVPVLARFENGNWTKYRVDPDHEIAIHGIDVDANGVAYASGAQIDRSAKSLDAKVPVRRPYAVVVGANGVEEIPVARAANETGHLAAIFIEPDGSVWAGGTLGTLDREGRAALFRARC